MRNSILDSKKFFGVLSLSSLINIPNESKAKGHCCVDELKCEIIVASMFIQEDLSNRMEVKKIFTVEVDQISVSVFFGALIGLCPNTNSAVLL